MIRVYATLAALAVVAGAALWLRHEAVATERAHTAATAARDAAAAHERMNDAPISTGNPDDDLDWLRAFGRAPTGPR